LDGRPRLIQIKGIDLEAGFAAHMLYVTNEDKPGSIGRLGTLLGNAGINIASFALGRSAPGADAIALVEVDGAIPEDILAEIRNLPLVRQAKALAF
jgi:D-3-phosphoglycerate dehydrogenase